jgi:non-hemolytic enterotoxin A
MPNIRANDANEWLAVPSVLTAVAALANVFLRLNAAAQAVLAQRDVALRLIPTLPQTQALARAHLTDWIEDYETDLLQAIIDVGGFANEYADFDKEFASLAAGVDAGNANDRQELLAGLADLRATLQKIRGQLAAQKDQIEAFRNLIADDETRFASDAESVERTYTGPGGQLAALKKEIADLQARLDEDNATIAEGATEAIPGILITAVGVAIDYADTDVGQVVVDAGLDMVKGAIAKSDQAEADFTTTIANYKARLIELKADDLDLAVFQTVKAQVAKASTLGAQVYDAMGQMDAAWIDVDNGFDVMVQTLKEQDAPAAGELERQFTAGKGFWATTKAQIDAFENVLSDVANPTPPAGTSAA